MTQYGSHVESSSNASTVPATPKEAQRVGSKFVWMLLGARRRATSMMLETVPTTTRREPFTWRLDLPISAAIASLRRITGDG